MNHQAAAEKVGLQAVQPAAAKAAIDFAALTARLKPRPFKTRSKFDKRRSKSEFFRSLLRISTDAHNDRALVTVMPTARLARRCFP